MMKALIKRFLQFILGFENYLYLFSRYIVATLRRNRKEGDFVLFAGMLRNGTCVLDIGANIGAMSAYLGRMLPDSQIYAFEPIPVNIRTFKRLMRHYKLNNVSLIEKALGDRDAKIEMIMPRENKVRMHGLCHVVHESIETGPEGERFQMVQTSLDQIQEFGEMKDIGGIKIDVENYEYYVLQGAKELITKHKPLIYIELWDNENRKRCFDWILEQGYKIKVSDGGTLTEYDGSRHKTQNFFFTPV